MANDNDRGEELYRIAGIIASSGIEGAADMAHNIRKYVKIVVDRDIGPTNEVRALNTQLTEKVKELTTELATLKLAALEGEEVKSAAIKITRHRDDLLKAREDLRKENADLKQRLDAAEKLGARL